MTKAEDSLALKLYQRATRVKALRMLNDPKRMQTMTPRERDTIKIVRDEMNNRATGRPLDPTEQKTLIKFFAQGAN